MISRRRFIKGVVGTAAAFVTHSAAAVTPPPPNIIFILADDIGYGDVGWYGAQKVKTPNIDRIGREGIKFTDAHSTASVCTPTRYSIMTGEYAWRNPDGDHILSGVDPCAIDPAKPTIASVMKQAHYVTGLVGKWHLGLGTKENPVDYNSEISLGPADLGFDYCFYYPATNDRVPCVYIENRRVVGLDPADPIRVSYGDKVGDDPTGADHPEMLKMKADPSHSKTIVNGISRIGYMSGGKSARWVDEDMADTLTTKAVQFIEQNRREPFFLYFSPHDIHEPMAPNPRFKGTSECGARGDAIHELDWCVGQILDAVDRFARNTIVIFTSDNGGAIKNTYDDGTNSLHALQPPNGPLRGDKGGLYEGGHRVPFLARFHAPVEKWNKSSQLIGLVDLMATCAAVPGHKLPDNAGPDSFNALPALEGNDTPVRDHLVLQQNGHARLAIRQAQWKYIEPAKQQKNAAAAAVPGELYDLSNDLAESKNVAAENPDLVARMAGLLEQARSGPRTRP
ncbi:MAG: arylsulfatase [Candidatus Hydrogenedentes bacterium]|nr:arylsulfatase [Candidatus Hydrogenedentota bacterium]